MCNTRCMLIRRDFLYLYRLINRKFGIDLRRPCAQPADDIFDNGATAILSECMCSKLRVVPQSADDIHITAIGVVRDEFFGA